MGLPRVRELVGASCVLSCEPGTGMSNPGVKKATPLQRYEHLAVPNCLYSIISEKIRT